MACITLSDSRASRSMGRNAAAFSLLLPVSMHLTYHGDPSVQPSHRLAAMESLNASATLRWKGYHGSIEGGSGALSVATATQTELGGPGGESNPEELFSAALANCFTSTLTGMARSRGIPLGEIETSVSTRLSWGEGSSHHLSEAALHTRVESPAPTEQVRALIDEAQAHCPVCQAIADRVSLTVSADVVAAAE
jgi:organic hydroperoxide reductase OsmC/OhrA